MAESIIERAARTACEAAGYRWDGSDWAPGYPDQDDWRKAARAVLEAIREPSEGMKSAAYDFDITESFDTTADQTWRYVSDEDAGAIWQTMIDAALEE